MDIITTSHLTKNYGKNRGITDLTLSVSKGDFFGFIGPNGAGKSTTIRLLLGLIRPTSGNAHVCGMDVSRNRRRILEHIGYIPAETMFYPGTTVDDILRLSARLRKKDCRNESQKLCRRLGLDMRQKTDALSLGNRKKVSIVCALQHRPQICIFDEPTSGLDPLVQKEFFDILNERRKEGATIFLSSHILSEVQTYCSKAAVIREGKLIAYGGMTELMRSSARRITLTGAQTDVLVPKTLITAGFDIRDFKNEGGIISFLYQGDMHALLYALAGFSFTDITITEPDLNEIFMHFYE